YRLHAKALPGAPDIVFAAKKKVIFVHGCFWHQHTGCKVSHVPKSRSEFWRKKLSSNVDRDKSCRYALRKLGWRYLTIWECQTTSAQSLASRLKRFLN